MRGVRCIAVLWENVTGYVQAALGGLLSDPEVTLFVVQRSEQANAPFRADFAGRATLIRLHDRPADDASWLNDLIAFAPEVALITGTPDPRYLEAARRIHQAGGITVWANDRMLRSWWRDAYQWYAGRIRHEWRNYGFAFVPGTAGAAYARYIGFPANRISQGLYTCDTGLFRPVGQARHQVGGSTEWPRVFLFLGQFIERKGIDLLIDAYHRYRECTLHPWELWCVGSGPLEKMIEGVPGVRRLPFHPSAECARLMGEVGALILPSRWDHWGVVIHEATCAGLPIIASRGCGAIYDLVVEERNGYTFPVGDVSALTHQMIRFGDQNRARQMGAQSLQLSWRFDPTIFARTVRELIPAMAQG
jgi:glycosyltransferase involved in cell wall biosynthesis